MNKTNSPQDEVKNLFLAFCEASSQDIKIADEMLREEDIDPQTAEIKGQELFRKYQLSRQFAQKAVQNKSALDRARQFVLEQASKVLNALPSDQDRRLALQTMLCRDYKELSNQEVDVILNDQTTLDLLENMVTNPHDPTEGTQDSRS